MNSLFLSSFTVIVIFCLPLWYDASRRKEYGVRPMLLLISLISFSLFGVCSYIALSLAGNDPKWGYPLSLVLQIFIIPVFLLLEYSVHIQRIKKNMLFHDFKKRFLSVLLLLAGAVIICVIGLLIYLLMAPNSNLRFLYKLLFSFFLSYVYASINKMFDLQHGVIRNKKYLFNAGIFFTLLMLVDAIFFEAKLPKTYFLFMIFNIVFVVRVYHEYFFYRMRHLSDMHNQMVVQEETQTELINQVLFTPNENDNQMLNSTLKMFLDNLQRSVTNSELAFRSMMLFRRNGNILAVDSDDLILGYCVPLLDIPSIKQMHSNVLNNHIKAQVFDIKKIETEELTDKSDFASVLVKKMIIEKKPVLVNPMPVNFEGLFRLIVLYPIYNQNELAGMLVVFKDEYNYIFPQEDNVLKPFVNNLSIILTIIAGKKIQDEKNRLNQEMDIAKNIQMSILPKNIKMNGYEVCTDMVTATEVGGDLYDYMPSKYGNYLDIGDVSGHGLPAGIMALIHMAALHSAVRTSEVVGRELSITKLYDVINMVLVDINRDRIGSDKFMTCNMLIENSGNFKYAGSHLVGLIYRKIKNSVEELTGMIDHAAFLGLSEFVNSEQSLGEFTMQPGDVLLLYTDGLTEARNRNNNLFGLDNLKEVFFKTINEPLDEIKKAIIESLVAYAENGDRKKYGGSFADDVSMVIVRKR